MDMVSLYLSLRTPRACSLQPSHPLAAVLAFWHCPVRWGGSHTSRSRMKKSTMITITKEVGTAR
ncbi:hypothetical protein CIB84_011934 [Bambusicola thoracicus]|uniref:Uncharacterized protein n=1 Tax=Bambusicola thoracicus TaxID=9083 RepID=A0A2P4SJM8_BAMTH|nr:hypothetical protein CIB84_011934 [Bambusicola thoracicus]